MPTEVSVPRHAKPDELRSLPKQFRTFKVIVERERLAARADGDERIPIALSSEEPYGRWYGFEILGHAKGEVDFTYIKAGNGLPFCFEHDTEKQIGFVEDIALDKDGVLRGMVRFGNHPDAPWIKADMEAGIRQFISIGYWVNAMKLIETDENGVDSYRVTNWTPLEGSTVAVPADPIGAGVGRSSGRAEHPVSLEVPVPQPPPTEAQERSMPDPTPAAEPKAPNAEEIRAAEVKRSSAILTLCSEHDIPLDTANDMIGRGITADQAAQEILKVKKTAAPKPGVVVPGATREEEKPFGSFGEFLQVVARAGRNRGTDPRLMSRASGMSEGSPADGGFAVPPEFATEILRNVWTQGQVLSRCARRPMGTGQLKINAFKENSRVDGSRYGGVQAYWAAEAATVTAKKPQLRQIELNAQKLFGVWYATDELLEDAPALEAEASEAFRQELIFKAEDAIINGVGAGMPLGVLNSGAVVQVAIEGGETLANSPASLAINTAKMYARMPAALIPDACWFINQDILPYLVVMTLGGTAAAQPIYLPPGAIKDSPSGSLWGRPIVPIEQAATAGTPGDIIFAAMSQYIVGERSGPKLAQSMHVQFLTDEMTFRTTWRLDGQPRWNTPVTPFKGSNTQSPYITLGTRA